MEWCMEHLRVLIKINQIKMGGKKDKIRTRWQTLGNYLFEWKLQSGVKFRNKNSLRNILVFHSATASTFITQNKVFVQALYIWCRLTSWRRHFADLDNRQELQKDSFQFFLSIFSILGQQARIRKKIPFSFSQFSQFRFNNNLSE